MKPNSLWFVKYAGYPTVAQVSDCGKGFYLPGYGRRMEFDSAEWIHEIRTDGEYICAKCGLRQDKNEKTEIEF